MPTTPAAKKTYKPVLELPPLSAEEHDGLRARIALHGVLVPIMLTEDGRIIDGSNRKSIAGELGSDPVTTRQRPDELRGSPSGRTRWMGCIHRTAIERGGSVPPNCLIVPKGGGSPGSEDLPAVTPMAL